MLCISYPVCRYDEALSFALGAEDLFKIDNTADEYVDTIIAKAIDRYIADKKTQVTENKDLKIDPRVERVVQLMFTRCFHDAEYQQAIGIALESFRLDIVEESFNLLKSDQVYPLFLQLITQVAEKSKLLNWVLYASMNIVENLDFRNNILRLLVKQYHELSEPDYDSVCQCFIHLNDTTSCAQMLKDLVARDEVVHFVCF